MVADVYPDTMRWFCAACETWDDHPWPTSYEAVQSQLDEYACGTCGATDVFLPWRMAFTEMQLSVAEDNREMPGEHGETVAEALDESELGTAGDPEARLEYEDNTCVCDRCDAVVDPGTYVTGYAFQNPKIHDEDEWVLFEIYCEECDISTLIMGSDVTIDVLVHARVDEWGELYMFADVAEIERVGTGDSPSIVDPDKNKTA